MKRIIIAGAALAFFASAANAAPGFGARGMSLSSDMAASKAARADESPVLVWLASLLNAKLKGETTAPASKSKRDTSSSQYECEEEKKAEDKEAAAPAKPGLQGGPEPVYLAF